MHHRYTPVTVCSYFCHSQAPYKIISLSFIIFKGCTHVLNSLDGHLASSSLYVPQTSSWEYYFINIFIRFPYQYFYIPYCDTSDETMLSSISNKR